MLFKLQIVFKLTQCHVIYIVLCHISVSMLIKAILLFRKNSVTNLRRLPEVLQSGWRNRIGNAARPMRTFLLLNLNFSIIVMSTFYVIELELQYCVGDVAM